MSDRGRITAGLAVFVALVAFPLWQTLGTSADRARPELELPVDESSCVESTEYIRAYHMDLLNSWRTAVVRDGGREYTAASGKVYEMSLTGTCMGCHSNRDTFCTRCHDYADVAPRCWDCHVEPEGS
jgi:hypothetical protein